MYNYIHDKKIVFKGGKRNFDSQNKYNLVGELYIKLLYHQPVVDFKLKMYNLLLVQHAVEKMVPLTRNKIFRSKQ